MALERRAGAKRNDRHRVLGADPDDLLHVLRRLRKEDGVGRLVVVPSGGMPVLLTHRLRGDEPIAERGREIRDRTADRFGVRLLQHIWHPRGETVARISNRRNPGSIDLSRQRRRPPPRPPKRSPPNRSSSNPPRLAPSSTRV